jgi:hypothetical protein
MQILLHDRVRWQSPDGTLAGAVVAIYNAQDAYGDVINFYHIEYSDGFGGTNMALLAETEAYYIELEVI